MFLCVFGLFLWLIFIILVLLLFFAWRWVLLLWPDMLVCLARLRSSLCWTSRQVYLHSAMQCHPLSSGDIVTLLLFRRPESRSNIFYSKLWLDKHKSNFCPQIYDQWSIVVQLQHCTVWHSTFLQTPKPSCAVINTYQDNGEQANETTVAKAKKIGPAGI